MDVDQELSVDPSTTGLASDAEAVVQAMLNSNFDAVTKTAVSTLVRYLHNLLTRSDEEVVRSISIQNKVFREKVSSVRGAVSVLQFAGFQENPLEFKLTFSDSNLDLSKARAVFNALHKAMDDLCMTQEERPKLVAPVKPEMSTAPASSVQFDPFKPLIVRPAIGGVAADPSIADPVSIEILSSSDSKKVSGSTDMQLLELRRRRKELEGERGTVRRNTIAMYPGDTNNSPSSLSTENTTDTENSGAPASGGLPKSVLQKTLKALSGDGSSDAPLTTRAVRALQKLQQEKVYREVVLRVRLPDQLQFIGRFHPRDTLADVYLWLKYVCFFDEHYDSNGTDSTARWQSEESGDVSFSLPNVEAERVQEAIQFFSQVCELYTAPPRTVYPPTRLSPLSKGNLGRRQLQEELNEDEDRNILSPTLREVGFTPAAMLNLQWRPAHASRVQQMQKFAYVNEQLQARSAEKQRQQQIDQVASRPEGIALVANSSSSDPSLLSSNSDGKASSQNKKPKWFKL
jgi:hypothetical protein